MITKKGKKWALSCVALSATVLAGMSTTIYVKADGISNSDTSQTHEKVKSLDIENNDVESEEAINDTVEAVIRNTTTARKDFEGSNDKGLGIAAHFHIFANEATLRGHTNGNMAVDKLYASEAFGTKEVEKHIKEEIYYIENVIGIKSSGFIKQTDSRCSRVIFGANNAISFHEDDGYTVNNIGLGNLTKGEVYQDNDEYKYIDFALEFAELTRISEEISAFEENVNLTSADFTDHNNRDIYLDDYVPNANGQIIINLDASVLNTGTPLRIRGLSPDIEGTDVIINVDTGGAAVYNVGSTIKLFYTNGDEVDLDERHPQETDYFENNHLLWNFVNGNAAHNGEIVMQGAFQGSILAPKATIKSNHNIDGNIIVDKIDVSGETHRWDFGDALVEPEEGENELPPPVVEPPVDPPVVDPPVVEPPVDPPVVDPPIDPFDPDIDIPITDSGSENEFDNKDENKDEDKNEDKVTTVPTGNNGGSGGGGTTNSLSRSFTVPNVVRNTSNTATPTPTSTGSSANTSRVSTLPSAGSKTGILATISGVLLLAFGFMSKMVKSKEE